MPGSCNGQNMGVIAVLSLLNTGSFNAPSGWPNMFESPYSYFHSVPFTFAMSKVGLIGPPLPLSAH